jgi:lipopolysaccharide export system permease protein
VIRIKQVDRLIMRAVLGAILIVWLVLVGIDALDQLMRQIGYIGQNHYTMANALAFIGLTLPRRMYQHFASASLVGGLLALGGLAASGELTALRAAGMSKLRIALSAVGTVAVLTLLVMTMSETIGPMGDQQARTMQLRTRFGSVGLGQRGGLWARDGDRFVNAREALATRQHGLPGVRLVDVRVFELGDDGQLDRLIHAADALQSNGRWSLRNVDIYRIDHQGVRHEHRTRMPWSTLLDAAVLRQSVLPPDYLSMRDQLRNIRYMRANGLNPVGYATAFWAHALFPLKVLALVLFAMPFAFGTLRSGGLGKRIFIGMILAIAWYFLQRVLTGTAVVYGVPPMLATLGPTLVLLVISGVYFRRFG